MLDFSLLGKNTVHELVYKELKHRIMSGELEPGERIYEVKLANELGVSRTPIREVVKALETEKLLTRIPRKGCYVTRIPDDEISELLEIRQHVEGIAASYASERISKEQKDRLLKANKLYCDAVLVEDVQRMMKYNEEFHRLLIESSNNKTLINMAGKLLEAIPPIHYLKYCRNHGEKTINEHSQILNAILNGECDSARSAACSHIEGLHPQYSA